MLRFIRWFLLVTFIAVIIADLAECVPINHYWQVRPDPGPKCRQGYAWLITTGSANVITDLLLIFFPIPIIVRSHMPVKRKLQLVLLFGLSVLPIGTNLYQIPKIIEKHGVQQYRSLWASVEILFATGVANALVLGSFVRDRGVKKMKWKYASTTDSMDRVSSRRGTVVQQWGSDEDLVRDLGLGVDPELRGSVSSSLKPRIAPMAVPGNIPIAARPLKDWRFPAHSDADSEDFEILKVPEQAHSPGDISTTLIPRKVSFFDVGGLLGPDQELRRTSSTTSDIAAGSGAAPSTASHDFAVPQTSSARRGSTVLLQDLGGLLPLSSQTTQIPWRSGVAESRRLSSTGGNSPPRSSAQRRSSTQPLQDVGGLLK
jgi:hypothetical protein